VILIFIFNSCRNKTAISGRNELGNPPSSKRINPIYLVDFEYKKMADEEFLSNSARVMSLPPISPDSNDQKMRIWLWDDTAYIIDICINKFRDSCEVVKYTSKKARAKEYFEVINVFKNLVPNSGWKNFEDTIEKFMTFSSSLKKHPQKFNGNDYLTKMSFIELQINDHGKHYYFKYLEPSYFRYTDRSSMKLFNFLKYFDYEFKIPIYNPAEKLFVYTNKGKYR
jgi:hypothetical protein